MSKMKKQFLYSLALISIVLAGCTEHGPFERQEKIVETEPFDRIRYSGSSEVRVYESDVFQVILNGRKIDLDRTDVEVVGGRLIIEEKKQIDRDQLIEIYTSDLTELEVNGSGEVEVVSTFPHQDNFNLSLNGSGEIEINVDCTELDIDQTGSGEIEISGQTTSGDYEITGSGWLHAFQLTTESAILRITGSGSAEVFVATDLDAIITGSGDVYYKGQPSVNTNITGSGSVINAN